MTGNTPIEWNKDWIEALSSDDPAARATAAAQIYRVGSERAALAVSACWQNAELAALCGRSPKPTVGLAVRPETFARIRAAHNFPRLADVPPEQDASEFELHFDGGIALDILTTRDPQGSGAIAKFLSKQGEGIQQVEFRCSDVDRAAAILRDQFHITSVYPQKRPGADGSHVNFFLVPGPDSSKILIELYEQ
jgi:hypothetical protein